MTFGFWDVGLPLTVVTVLAVVVPVVTVPRAAMDQGRLAFGIVLAAIVVFSSAVGWFALFHWQAGDAFRWGAVLRPALMTGIVWGPVLGLVWLVRAQAVEARKGRAAARAGLDLGNGG